MRQFLNQRDWLGEKVLAKAAWQDFLKRLNGRFEGKEVGLRTRVSKNAFCGSAGFLQSGREIWRRLLKNKAASARSAKRVSPLEKA